MIRFKFTKPQNIDDYPGIEGFVIPDGGIAHGPDGGLRQGYCNILIHFGWFLDDGERIKVAGAETVKLQGDVYANLMFGKAGDSDRFTDLITQSYQAVSDYKEWKGELIGMEQSKARIQSDLDIHQRLGVD